MDKFLEEYNSEEAVRKYTKETAGFGISYLLEHDYGKIYLEAAKKYLLVGTEQIHMKILEFGCGGGMNLIHLLLMFERQGINVHSAYGTDFSSTLIDAAKSETKKYLSREQQKKVVFCVARNENLVQDMATQLNTEKKNILESFHLIIGVNTSRYCHRLNKEMEYAKDILALLVKGGICVMIDMNNKFPFYRSRMGIRDTMNTQEYYIPSLDEYAHPFQENGFQILRKDNFCWIPHSAGPYLLKVFKIMTPLLNRVAPGYAMRSLVIARKN